MTSDLRVALILGLVLVTGRAWCQEPPDAAERLERLRLERLQGLNAVERDELRRREQRFSELNAGEQDRLRQLEQQLQQDPQGDELRTIMLEYHSWLGALSSSQRTEILGLPPDERLRKIKQRLDEQEDQRLKELALQYVTPEDINEVSRWLGEVFRTAIPTLLEELPEEHRQHWKGATGFRLLPVVFMVMRKRSLSEDPLRYEKMLKYGERDREELVSRLSDSAQQAYRTQASEEDRRRLVHNWVRGAIARESARPTRLSPEDLRKFLADADPELRDKLDYLPPERLWYEFQRHMMRNVVQGRPGGWSGGPFPGKGPPGGFFPPRRPPDDEERP